MRKILLVATIFCSAQSVQAEWTWGDTAAFAAGAAVPLIAHEAGHQLLGGKDIEWDGTAWRCVSDCNQSRIAGGGFVAEAAVSEAVARAFDEPRYRAFRLGVRTSAGLHLLTYALRNDRDFENFSKSDRKKARAIAAVAGLFNLIQIKGEF